MAKVKPPNYDDFDLLPTGKPNISFSELHDWVECSYRHKLKHIDKIGEFEDAPIPTMGTAVHEACQHYLETRVMDHKIALRYLKQAWDKNQDVEGFDVQSFLEFGQIAKDILAEVPAFVDANFKDWQYVDAEHLLFENVDLEGHNHAFKGYIDGVITAKGARGKDLYWLIDWKTTSWGWHRLKKQDFNVRMQLNLYKHYWSKKFDIDPKDVRCAFVLLKRTGKPGARCELFPVSVGETTNKKTLTVVNNMLRSVKKGIAIKNRNSCRFCDYKDTPHCP